MKLLVGIFSKISKDKPSPKTMSENISFGCSFLLNQSTASSTECNVATNCKSEKLLNNLSSFLAAGFSSSMIIVLIIFQWFEMVRFCLKWFDVLLPRQNFLKSYTLKKILPLLDCFVSRNKWDFFMIGFYFSPLFLGFSFLPSFFRGKS